MFVNCLWIVGIATLAHGYKVSVPANEVGSAGSPPKAVLQVRVHG